MTEDGAQRTDPPPSVLRPLSSVLFLAFTAASAFGQALVCPTLPAGRCDTFHYHVQMYRPDTRGFIEFYGINNFPSMSACDRARDAAVRQNLAVVDVYRKRGDQRYEPDHFGPCHCDTASLNDVVRNAQLRLYGDAKMKVRERLMDADVPTDSELMRSAEPPPSAPAGPKLVPLPSAPPAVTASPNDLKMPKSAELAAPPMADLPLVEVASQPVPAPVPVPESQPAPPPAPAPAPAPPPAPAPAPEPPSAPTLTVEPTDDPAEPFLSVETDRVQKIIAALGSATDVKIFDATSKRLDLLSNLRTLIATNARLAAAARAAAHAETERLALVAKLFGSDMPSHWAPKYARDVVVELVPNPETVLRDPNAPAEAKRHALYAYLATTQTVDAWVGGVVEALLQ